MSAMEQGDLHSDAKDTLSNWLQSVLSSRAVQYADLFESKGISSVKRLQININRDPNFLLSLGVSNDDAEEIAAAAKEMGILPAEQLSGAHNQVDVPDYDVHQESVISPVSSMGSGYIHHDYPSADSIAVLLNPCNDVSPTISNPPSMAMSQPSVLSLSLPVDKTETETKPVPLVSELATLPPPQGASPWKLAKNDCFDSFSDSKASSQELAPAERGSVSRRMPRSGLAQDPHDWNSIISTANPEILNINDLLGHESVANETKPRIGRTFNPIPAESPQLAEANEDGSIIKAIRRNTIGKLFNQAKDAASVSALSSAEKVVSSNTDDVVKAKRRFSLGDLMGNKLKEASQDKVGMGLREQAAEAPISISRDFSTTEEIEVAASATSGEYLLDNQCVQLDKTLSRIEEDTELADIITLPMQRKASGNISIPTYAKATSAEVPEEVIQLSRSASSSMQRRKSDVIMENGSDTIQVGKSFSLARLFDKSDKGTKVSFLEETPQKRIDRLQTDTSRPTYKAMVAFGHEISHAVDTMAGFQVTRHCNGYCALIDTQQHDVLLVDDILASGINMHVVSALLRFSDDIHVAEACLDAICAACTLGLGEAKLAEPKSETTGGAVKDDRILHQFSVPDTFTALNAVLFNCDTQLNVAVEPLLSSMGSASFAFSEPGNISVASVASEAGDNTLKENAIDEKASLATIINLAARIMGILAAHSPNAVSIADGGLYDNLLRASKTLIVSRADVAAEVCWAMRCIAVNRTNITIKKLFMVSESTIKILMSSLLHTKSEQACRGACRAIVNLCAIDSICAVHLLSAGVIVRLSEALEQQLQSAEAAKWITMALSTLLLDHRHAASNTDASNDTINAKQSILTATAPKIPNNDLSSASGLISAVRAKSAAAIFRGNSNPLKSSNFTTTALNSAVDFAPNGSPKESTKNKNLFRLSSTQSDFSDVPESGNNELVSSSSGINSLFRLHSKGSRPSPSYVTSSEIVNRLQRSTSTLDHHGGASEFDGRNLLKDPQIITKHLIRPIIETGLCKKIVNSLVENGQNDSSTAEWLCHTIYLLSLKEGLCTELEQAKASTAVVKVIATYSTSSYAVMRRACSALGSLCVGSTENRDQVYDLNGHFYIINSLLAHGKLNEKKSARGKVLNVTFDWVEELSIIQECWALKKLAVDSKLRQTMLHYSLFEAINGIITKYSGHTDISLQCVKLLLVVITAEKEKSLEACLEFKDKVSLKALMSTIDKCIDDVTMVKYSLILINVLCCRFSGFKSIESTHKFSSASKQDKVLAEVCTVHSCSAWHGPYIDSAECEAWATRNRDEAVTVCDAPLTPLCSCKARGCKYLVGVGLDDSVAEGSTEAHSGMLSHYHCFSLPDMQNALVLSKAPEFIVSCMKRYSNSNQSIAEWGCRAAFAMTVEGRGDLMQVMPLLCRGQYASSHSNDESLGCLGSKKFNTENCFREEQFTDSSLETDIYRSGEVSFGGPYSTARGIPVNSCSNDNSDVSDIFLTDRSYHGYFQLCHPSSLEASDEFGVSSTKAIGYGIGTQRMLNGDGVNFRCTKPFLKLGICQVLSEVLQKHSSSEQAVIWAARATSNMMSIKAFIDSSSDHRLRFLDDIGVNDDKLGVESSKMAALAKECNLLNHIFQVINRSPLANPEMCQYWCETVYVLAQDAVLSSWMGGLGACSLVFDILVKYMPYYSVCKAALLAMGALAKTCPDNATRFHTDTNMDHSYEEIFNAIRHHRCEHTPGVAEEGFLAALYCNSGSAGDAKLSQLCPKVVNSVIEYHSNDLGVCLAVLHFVRKNTIGSESNGAVMCGTDGAFFKLLLRLMQHRVEVICGCIETAEVRMNDILEHAGDEDFRAQADVDDYFETSSQIQDYAAVKPIYMNTFNIKARSWMQHEASPSKVTQRQVDQYYEANYSDISRRGDGGPYSVISLGCVLIAHFSSLNMGEESCIPSPRRIMIENGVCEMLALILNSSMVDAICLGADFRQSGLVSHTGWSPTTASEYKILMGPRTALHVLSSVVEASGVSVVSRTSLMSLIAIFSLLRSGCGETDSTYDFPSVVSVQADACTRFLALGVGTSLIACLRSFPLIQDCLLSRLSLNILTVLSMGCTNVIARNNESYILKYFSPQQKPAVTMQNLIYLFKDQIDNKDAWRAIIDAIPYFISTSNPLLWLTDAGIDNLSPEEVVEATTSVALVSSACRCIIAASGFGVGELVSGVILSQANAFNVLLATLRGLRLGGPVEVNVSLLRALAAVAHEIGSKEKLDAVEVILKYMTQVANSPPPVIIAALQCVCSLAGGMPPVYIQRGHQVIYKGGDHVLQEGVPLSSQLAEAYYFDHLYRHICSPVDSSNKKMMLHSTRACAKIVKTLLRHVKALDVLSPSVLGIAGTSSFNVSPGGGAVKEAVGVIDVIQWCMIAMTTMCRNDANKQKLCTAEAAECLVSLLRICCRVQVGGITVVQPSAVALWNICVEDYMEMMVSRGCGSDVEWMQGIKHGSFRMLTECVIKTMITLCIGPIVTPEPSLLDEVCERVDVGMRCKESRAAVASGKAKKTKLEGLSVMRWFKRKVKTSKRHKNHSFHEANVSRLISLQAPAVLLDILGKYGEYSAIICYQACCGLYLLCGASAGHLERGSNGTAVDELISTGRPTPESISTVSTDVLWGRHEIHVMTSAETGIGYDSGSVAPADAALTLYRLLLQYTNRSKGALRACARVVGLLASVKCTAPIASALGKAGCCKAILTALAVQSDDSDTCIHILHAVGSLAASSSIYSADEDTLAKPVCQANQISSLLSEMGAVAQISTFLHRNYTVDCELCTVSCKALYFLMNVPGFSLMPLGSFDEQSTMPGQPCIDLSSAQKQVVSSSLLDILKSILSFYCTASEKPTPTSVLEKTRRRTIREQHLGEPASSAIMLTGCLLCVSRVPLFIQYDHSADTAVDNFMTGNYGVVPGLICNILRKFGAQDIPLHILDNLFAAAFAGLHNLMKQPNIRHEMVASTDNPSRDVWMPYTELLMDALTKYKSPGVTEYGLLCIAAIASSEPGDREAVRLNCKLNRTEQEKAELIHYCTKSLPALDALGSEGACEKVLSVLQTDESSDVILATLHAYYALVSFGGKTSAGVLKTCGFGNRDTLCSEKALRRLLLTGDVHARQNAKIALFLCRIIAYASSCSFYEAPIYQNRLIDGKVAIFLKSMFMTYTDNVDVIQASLLATAFLCHHNSKIRDRLGAEGLCEAVCGMLSMYVDIDERVAWCSLFAIVNLSTNNAKNAFKIGSSGACDHIVKAVKIYGSTMEASLSCVAEWIIDTTMGGNELPDCGWFARFGLRNYANVLTIGCYAIVNIGSFSDALSLPFVSARLDAQLNETGVTALKAAVVDYINYCDEARAESNDPRLFSTNLSRFWASGACELLVDLMKNQVEIQAVISINAPVDSVGGVASQTVSARLACASKALALAALRLCDDASNIQRMRSRGIGLVLSGPYLQSDSEPDTKVAGEKCTGADFWSDLVKVKDSNLSKSCFGKPLCESDIELICRDIRSKIQE